MPNGIVEREKIILFRWPPYKIIMRENLARENLRKKETAA
jgi:hypothetical protein